MTEGNDAKRNEICQPLKKQRSSKTKEEENEPENELDGEDVDKGQK
jgi:hypothetical protein